MERGIFVCLFLYLTLIATSTPALNISEEKYFKKEKNILPDKKSSRLKSRSLYFNKKDFRANFTKEKGEKRIYVNLKKINKNTINNLKKEFSLDYVADDTYIIKVNKSTLEKLKKRYDVNGFSDIYYVDKLSEKLYRGKFSEHAKEGNFINLKVTIYKDILLTNAISQIRSVGGIILSEKFSLTNKLQVSIYQDDIDKLASLDIVKYIDEISPPLTTENIDAGKLSNVFWDGVGDSLSGLCDFPYNLSGNGVNVAIKDGGKVDDHIDFEDRLHIVDDDLVHYHPTHVAGTIAGKQYLDVTYKRGGMASSVDLYSYSFFVVGTNQQYQDPEFTTDFISAIENYNASIINNSWSEVITWTYRNDFGNYNTDSEDMDFFIYDYFYDNALITKSAGNYRDDYIQYNYNCIAPIGCSKNSITVGSVGKEEGSQFYPYTSSDFSSWGPTDDGRIKPDIVADGYYLLSTGKGNPAK